MKRLIGLLLLSALLAFPAFAQEPEEPYPDSPRVTLSGAYSFVRTNLFDAPDGDNAAAVEASAAVRFGKNWAGRADAISFTDGGSNPFADSETQVYAAGPEYRFLANKLGLPSSQSFNPDKVELFAHALAGAIRRGADSDFAYVVGGGADYLWNGSFSIRLFQVQYISAPHNEADNFKLTSGVSFNF